jgi:hypothetical protein
MWECGVATDPTDATPLTRIAVCRAGKDVPPVFEDSVLFSIDEAGILSFTGQFHREEDFFIKGKAFQKNVTDEIIQSKGNALLKDLRRVLPPLEKREERYRWDFFTLKINPENIIQIKNENNFDKKIEFIKSESEVERDFGQALKHFNFDPNTSGLKLANIINRWLRSITKIEENTPKEWINDLCGEMLRAIDAEPSKPTWQLMRSMLFHDWWFYPIVNHVRVEPNGTMEFDIYMYRLPGSLPEKA